MNARTWIVASVLSLAVLGGFVGLSVWQYRTESQHLRTELKKAQTEAEKVQTEAELHTVEVSSLKEALAEARATIEGLQKEKAETAQAQKSLEEEMRAALQSKEITISELQGKLTVNILDRIMFDSGEAVLKPGGEKVLEQIAGVLSQYPDRQIHVIGHTDDVPIRPAARSRFATNWELSTARATAAVRFLCEKAGVDARRLGAVGYGEFRPVADNSSAEGRAKNRRIALVVLSEHLVGSDAPPAGVAPLITKPPTVADP